MCFAGWWAQPFKPPRAPRQRTTLFNLPCSPVLWNEGKKYSSCLVSRVLFVCSELFFITLVQWVSMGNNTQEIIGTSDGVKIGNAGLNTIFTHTHKKSILTSNRSISLNQ